MSDRKSMPKKLQAEVFIRDKWCCRYCGIEVLFSSALKTMEQLSPDHGYYHKNGRKDKMSSHLLNRCAAIDHINPISLGGTNDINNLLCVCWECNTTKSNQEPSKWVERIIPLDRLIPAEGWDGFLSLLRYFESDNEWLKYFNK